MSSEELSTQQKQEFFTQERNRYQKILNEMRKERTALHEKATNKYYQYIEKIGELSLIFGAAIVPVALSTQARIGEPIILFIAISIYLFNGFLALWKIKTQVEPEVDSSLNIGLDFETEVQEIKHSLNKLIHQPENEAYLEDYFKLTKQYVEKHAGNKQENYRITFWLDGFVSLFILASITLSKLIWPFSKMSYFLFLAGAILLLLALITFSYIKARERRIKRNHLLEKLEEVEKEYLNWEKREIFKE